MTNTNKVKRTALDRQMDKIRDMEESGKLSTKLTNRALRKLTANKLAVLGVVMFFVICLLCFGAPLFTKYSPTAFALREKMQAPSLAHIFGTDQMGRDIWSRMLYGGRISIVVGLGSALGAALIGVTLGLFVGYKGGWLDNILMKVADIFLSFPQMVLIIIIVAWLARVCKTSLLFSSSPVGPVCTVWPEARCCLSKRRSLCKPCGPLASPTSKSPLSICCPTPLAPLW